MEKNDLLKEFELLIETIGTEVSAKISEQVSIEVSKHLMQETIFRELLTLQKEINTLVQKVPAVNQDINKNINYLQKQMSKYDEEMEIYHKLLQTHNHLLNNQIKNAKEFTDSANDVIRDYKEELLNPLKINGQEDLLKNALDLQRNTLRKVQEMEDEITALKKTTVRIESQLEKIVNAE